MKHSGKISRVDVQVSLIIGFIVIASFICVYFFQYTVTYHDMINSLQRRSDSIYRYVENYVDKTTFIGDLSSEDEGYLSTKQKLEDVKMATDVRYLYTAKRKEDGTYVYLVDGLPSDSEDFRHPNDAIEPEIIAELKRALSDEIVMPDTIKKTTWGEIFVSYYPIHENGTVIGVLGMEFDASHQYHAFRLLRIGTPIIAAIACVIAILIAGKLFRRISNPNFKDMANTDYLTKLKNRNAFMVDMRNMEVRQKETSGLIVVDVNDLKIINDTYGHQAGDACICATAELLSSCAETYPAYRIGGDEFAILVDHANCEKLEQIVLQIQNKIQNMKIEQDVILSVSIGMALYDSQLDDSLTDTFARADHEMYDKKRKFKNHDA